MLSGQREKNENDYEIFPSFRFLYEMSTSQGRKGEGDVFAGRHEDFLQFCFLFPFYLQDNQSLT